jgi:hypothetical protein
MRKVLNQLLAAIIVLLFFSSCASVKEAKRELKQEIVTVMQESRTVLKKLDRIDCIRTVKYENKQLDEQSNQFIQNYSDSLRNEILEHLHQDSQIVMRRIKHRSIDSLSIRAGRLKEQLKADTENIGLFDSLLATNTYNQFNTASVFGPGQFLIDSAMQTGILLPFQHVVEDLLDFAAKFPNKRLNGTFLVLGYADAQQITPGSGLDSTLRLSLGTADSVGSPVLNKELSRLRAVSVSNLILGQYEIKTNAGQQFPKLKVDYIPQGRGEEFPNPKVKNYLADDERRRVVLVYWSVLPDFD